MSAVSASVYWPDLAEQMQRDFDRLPPWAPHKKQIQRIARLMVKARPKRKGSYRP